MAIEQIDIEDFIKLSYDHPVLDVRSPGEFLHAHIPNAFSLPLFTDEQRKIIGTAYKKENRQIAVKKGLEFFSERMKIMPGEVEDIMEAAFPGANKVLVHCWRGGMRSGAVSWLLDLYGFKVLSLCGGYKTFRNWVLAQFEKQYRINIIGGYTGSGKTLLLHEMKRKGERIIDLEALANHKGSAFGSLGEKPQPTQEMFENLLAIELNKKAAADSRAGERLQDNFSSARLWLEDESRHIGTVGIPKTLWQQMRASPLFFLEIPFEQRLEYILSSYGIFDKKDLVNSIMKIQKRLGGLETKNAINHLLENNMKECFSILLTYYDKLYKNALYKRDDIEALLTGIPAESVDAKRLAVLLLAKRPLVKNQIL